LSAGFVAAFHLIKFAARALTAGIAPWRVRGRRRKSAPNRMAGVIATADWLLVVQGFIPKVFQRRMKKLASLSRKRYSGRKQAPIKTRINDEGAGVVGSIAVVEMLQL
jgi:hypothetical protein